MNHADTLRFLIQVALLLTVAFLFGRCAVWLRIPQVIGEIVGGLFLGPSLLGLTVPHFQTWLFPPEGLATLTQTTIRKFALLAFLFTAGLETRLPSNRAEGQRVVSVSFFGLAIPFIVAWGAAMIVPSFFGSEGLKPGFPIFLATALSISALPVIARIFMDLRLEHSALAATVLSAAAIDDLVGWGLFTLLLGQIDPGRQIGIWQVILLVGLVITAWGLRPHVARWTARWASEELLLPGFVILMLVMAGCVESLGFHGIFGAFLAGVFCAELQPTPAARIFSKITLSVLAPLYFVGIGLQINLWRDFSPALVAVLLAVACIGKVFGAGLGARLSGLLWRDAFAVGWAMNARGAMEIILATVALEHGLISHRLHTGLVFVALVTSFMAGPCLRAFHCRRKNVAPSLIPLPSMNAVMSTADRLQPR